MNVIALACLLFAAAPAGAESSASSAGQIFEQGAGARALGMGSAYTAAVHDATALYYNPSGFGLLEGRQIHVMRASLYGGAGYDYLGYAQNFRKRAGGWGVHMLRLSVTGGKGTDEFNQPTNGFGYAETAMGWGMGLRGVFFPDLSLGGGLKMLTRSLGSSSDRFLGIDLGTQYGPIADGRLSLGLAAHNILSKSQGDTSDKLPITFRLGAAYRIIGPLSVSMDFSDSHEMRLGTEYGFGSVALRAGYSPEGMTFGGGMSIRKSFTLDLAIINNASLGLSQRLSVGYKFGANKPKKLSAIAGEFLGNGIAELEKREYFNASRDIDTALGIDPAIGGPEWKRKAARLRRVLQGLEVLEGSTEADQLKADSTPALMAARSIKNLLDGDSSDAMLLAHVAAGNTGKDSIFMRLLQSMSKETRQSITREDVLPPGTFIQERTKRALDAIYARRYDIAVRACRDSLVVQPDDGAAWMRLGSAHFAAGDKSKALEAYRKALSLDDNNDNLRMFIEQNFRQ